MFGSAGGAGCCCWMKLVADGDEGVFYSVELNPDR